MSMARKKTKLTTRERSRKALTTPAQDDFAALDAWARKLSCKDGRALTPTERREERVTRSVRHAK